MGLSFHYSGNFKKSESLPKMIEEVKEVAEANNWKYFLFENDFDAKQLGSKKYTDNIYGLCFTPPGCETVFMSFLSNGRLSSPMHLKFYGGSKEYDEELYLYTQSVKTQYSSVEIHKIVIDLFRYISKKYFENFKLSDEGEYWETSDEKKLAYNFNRNLNLINSFADAFENSTAKPGETLEDHIKNILKKMQDEEGQE
ncbi:MAG: hypothetical protein ABI723_13460 [Bacteroidia bacterium]